MRRESLMKSFSGAGKNRWVILLIAFLELAAGLALVIAHPIFTFDWKGIISFIGAWMVIESVFFLIVSNKVADKVFKMVNKPVWYMLGGALSIVLGGYLAGVGFGLF